MLFMICILFNDHSGLVLVLVLATDLQTDCIINMYVCNDSDKTVAFELTAFSFFFFCFWNLIASGLLFSNLALPGSNSQINHKIKQQRPGHCFSILDHCFSILLRLWHK